MRTLLLLALLSPLTLHAEPSAHFAPQAFLAGACWKGTFPDGKRTDEHCYEWVFGRQFMRDRHTVKGGEAPYAGETIYYWDGESRLVNYLYFNVLGGHSRGTVTPADGVLYFPEENTATARRSRFTAASGGATATTLMSSYRRSRCPGGWKEAWRIRMQRQK